MRTWRKETPFLEQAAAPVAGVGAAGSRSIARNRAVRSGAPEVTFVPENKRVAAKEGLTLLEIAESNGMTIESGCRMGICGADPVAIKDGMECLSGISDDERATLERLGLAPNTRMACCARVQGPVQVALTPDKPKAPSLSKVHGFNYAKDVERVVIIGNGIAGVTAADHIRRRHPLTEIDLVAEEPHHLYNRMGIARLIYGRSAMQGLYLNPDTWYDERDITTWLNTRALGIDRAHREVTLGGGEALPYDRLVLAMGSSAFVPSIDGLGRAGNRRAAHGRRCAQAARLRAAPRREAGDDRGRRPARARGGLRAAQARAADRRDRALDASAHAASSTRARPSCCKQLPGGPRARDRGRRRDRVGRRRRPPVGRHARRRPLVRHRRPARRGRHHRRTSSWPRRPG